MGTHEYLFILAEISTVLVGFAAIIMAISPTADRTYFSDYTFKGVIERGLATAIFSLLPPLLVATTLISGYEYRFAGGGLLVYYLLSASRSMRWWQSFPSADRPISEFTFYWRLGATIVVLVALLANFWLALHWIYLVAVSWLFVNTALLILTYVNNPPGDT